VCSSIAATNREQERMNKEQFTQAVNAVTTIAMVMIMLTIIVGGTVIAFKARNDADAAHRIMPRRW
jgi:uncharacterized membrane protein YwzB